MKPLLSSLTLRLFAAGLLAVASAAAYADTRVRFDGGIGSQPFRTGANADTAAANRVFGLAPGGVPWVIADLKADVRDGRIRVDGRGLLLAGSDAIGTRGGITQVRARLFCDGVPSDSDLVTLEENGDFRINSVLIPTPAVPCNSPRLLILSSGGSWFAAGILDK
jgi:hypothetical protein